MGGALEIGVNEVGRKVASPCIKPGRPILIDRESDPDGLFVEDRNFTALDELGLNDDVDVVDVVAMGHCLETTKRIIG